MIRAVVFDLDGVLVDSEAINDRAIIEVACSFGLVLSPKDLSQKTGISTEGFFTLILQQRGLDPQEARRFADAKRKLGRELIQKEGVVLFSDTQDVLEVLRSQGLALGLATVAYRDRAELILEKAKIRKYFQEVVTGEEIIHEKPNPEIFLTLISRLAVNPKETIIVDDAPVGIQAAHTIGAWAIWKRITGLADQPGVEYADFQIDVLSGLLPILEHLNQEI